MKNVVKLSQRLTAIADMTEGGGCLCDVGTDHAHIPIRLLQEGRIRFYPNGSESPSADRSLIYTKARG